VADKAHDNTCRLRGKGEGERKNLYPLPFNLFPKPNSELKIHKASSIEAHEGEKRTKGQGE